MLSSELKGRSFAPSGCIAWAFERGYRVVEQLIEHLIIM